MRKRGKLTAVVSYRQHISLCRLRLFWRLLARVRGDFDTILQRLWRLLDDRQPSRWPRGGWLPIYLRYVFSPLCTLRIRFAFHWLHY